MSIFKNKFLHRLLISLPKDSKVVKITKDFIISSLPTYEDMVIEIDDDATPTAIKFFEGTSTISRPPKNGPAMITFHPGSVQPASVRYIKNGSLYRDPADGPAIINTDEDGAVNFFGYYVDGNEVKGPMNIEKKLKSFVRTLFTPDDFVKKIPVFEVERRFKGGKESCGFLTLSEFSSRKESAKPDERYFIIDFRRAVLNGNNKILI